MKFQQKRWSCGASAIVNAARATGLRVSERIVRIHAGTTKQDGTGPNGIKQALERLGFRYFEVDEAKYATAEGWLRQHLASGWPAILLAEAGDHWTVAFGLLGDKVLVFDGQNTIANKAESGVHVLTSKQLRRHWDPYKGKRCAILVKTGA